MEFIEFLNQVFSRLDNCIILQNLVPIPNYPKLNYEELKNEPNKVKDLITNFTRQQSIYKRGVTKDETRFEQSAK